MASRRTAKPGWGAVIVRVAVGSVLLAQGWDLVASGVDRDLVRSHESFLQASPGWYRWWATGVLLRVPVFAAYALAWGLVLSGAALIAGALTRPAACIGVVLMVHLHYGLGDPNPRFYFLTGCCAAACAVSRAGRTAGFDTFLDKRLPGWATWVETQRDMFTR